MTQKVRPGTSNPERWAAAVIAGLQAAEQPVQRTNVCQVFAVIEQESGYQANPTVPGIPAMVRRELSTRLRALGALEDDAVDALLAVKPKDSAQTFGERLQTVRTERDLDLLYRDVLDEASRRVPVVGAAAQTLATGWLDRQNPVTTLGSMQVSLEYARDQRPARGLHREELRESLYTLDGGVLFGTIRLFDGDPSYDDPIFRFADFNAGPFSSRNAAFQRQLQTLSGETVASDGDLLVYNERGRPRSTQEGQTVTVLTRWVQDHGLPLTPRQIRADLAHEKGARFEQTETWRTVRTAFEAKLGRPPVHAIVPAVTLSSPKLKGTWTTRTFAERVDKRFRACLDR